MNRFLFIALGAALGANARYWVTLWAANRFGTDYPYGTLLVNVTGSFLLGLLLTLATGRLNLAPETRLLLLTGFLGAYTTFSTYAVESLALWSDAGWWPALRNIFLNNGLGLGAALLGATLARLLG